MKKISLIILSFNTEKDTHDLLKSLEKVKHDGYKLEIIIIDNGSKELFTLLPNEKKDHVILIRSEVNTGFSGGNNIGLQKALDGGADYLMAINNDTIVAPDMIEQMLKVLDSDPQIGLTVPKIYFAKGREFHKDRYKPDELGKVFWYAGGSTDWANVRSIHRGVDEVDQGQYDKTEPVTFATGCCMFFKREVLEKVGLFDDRYFLYYEDADLNERIQKAGYKIYYVPSAILIHVNASSTGGAGSLLQDYFITRNQMLFGMSYAPLRTKLALIRQSLRLLLSGRTMQKRAIRDYYLRRFNKGTFFEK